MNPAPPVCVTGGHPPDWIERPPVTHQPLPERLRELAALVGGESGLNWTIHVWQKPAFIYLANPICACSTLKMSLNLSVAPYSDRPDFTITAPGDIHSRHANLLKSPLQLGYGAFLEMLDDPSVPVFTFVRAPEDRFLSAWRKKLTKENPFTGRVRAYLDQPKTVPLSDFLTLDQFAASVAEDQGLRDLDEHWRLQRKQIFFDGIPRTQFGRVETFAADAPRLLGQIFGAGNFVLSDATVLNPFNASGKKRVAMEGLSDFARAQVAKAYAADDKMLDEIKARATA
jgi:hypothetical protein